MLQLKNNTPFAASFILLPNDKGIDTVYVMIKATFMMGKDLILTKNQPAPQLEDTYLDEPAYSSIKLASDVHIGKKATDIIAIGHAIAPEGQSVQQLRAGISVGHTAKVIHVFGDRVWDGGSISPPQPFNSMPIVYERAYGGGIWKGEQCLDALPSNPVGKGYYTKKHKPQPGDPLPNIESPTALIQSPLDQPLPAGFGFIAPNWQPRVDYAGTYDENWQTMRAPFLPLDFNKLFCNAAHPDLIHTGFLQGGEPIQIKNMHAQGDIYAQVPNIKLRCKATVASQTTEVVPDIETLILQPNTLTMSMVWRAAIPAGKHIKSIKNLVLSVHR